jgi:hypothetical protein
VRGILGGRLRDDLHRLPGREHAVHAGSGQAESESPRSRGPAASSSSRRLSF